MLNFDSQYQALLSNIVEFGEPLATRGTNSRYLFNQSIALDCQKQSPILTLRNVYPLSAISEANWLLNGEAKLSKIKSKTMRQVWSAYADENGVIHNSYYTSLRAFPTDKQTVDQFDLAVQKLIKSPTSRAITIHFGIPGYKGQSPCQTSLVFSSDGSNLDLVVTARSSDAIYGLPSDIIVMYCWLQVVAKSTNLTPRFLAFNMVNAHIYKENIDDAKALIELPAHQPPAIKLNIDNYEFTGSLVGDYKFNSFKPTGKLNLGDLSVYH